MTTTAIADIPGLTIDADAIAKGILAMIDDAGDTESATVIKFGMLPVKWLDMAERQLRGSLMDKLKLSSVEVQLDDCLVLLRNEHGDPEFYEVKFSRLISDAMSQIGKAIYRHAEMVV